MSAITTFNDYEGVLFQNNWICQTGDLTKIQLLHRDLSIFQMRCCFARLGTIYTIQNR